MGDPGEPNYASFVGRDRDALDQQRALEVELEQQALARAERAAADARAVAAESEYRRRAGLRAALGVVKRGLRNWFSEVRIKRSRGIPLASLSAATGTQPASWNEAVSVLGVARPALDIHPPSRHSWDLDLPAGSTLSGWIALRPGAWELCAGGVTLTIRVDQLDGRELASRIVQIDPRRRRAHRRWVPWQWDLPAAGPCRLTVSSASPLGPDAQYAWGLLGDPRISGRWLPQLPTDAAVRVAGVIADGVAHLPAAPELTFLLPVHDPDPGLLDETLASVLGQTDPAWRCVVVDDGSSEPAVRERLASFAADPRVQLVRHESARGISAATNAAFAAASTEYVATLDHDDLLVPDAVQTVRAALAQDRAIDVLYSDNDLTAAGINFSASLKPDWSPDLMRAVMYTLHLGVYRRALVERVGGWRTEFDGAQDHDLVLRLTEQTNAIRHLPRVLYHWRAHAGSAALGDLAKPTAYDRGREAVAAHLERAGIGGAVERLPQAGRYRVRHTPAPVAATIVLSDHQDRGAALLALAELHDPVALLLILEAPMDFGLDAVEELTGLVAGANAGAAGGVVVDAEDRLAAGAIAFPEGLPVPVHPDGQLGPEPHATLSIVTNRFAVRGAVVVSAGAVLRHAGALARSSELLLVALTMAISEDGGRVVFSPHARFVADAPEAAALRRWPLAEAVRLDRGRTPDPFWNPQRWPDRGDETIPEAVHANPITLPPV